MTIDTLHAIVSSACDEFGRRQKSRLRRDALSGVDVIDVFTPMLDGTYWQSSLPVTQAELESSPSSLWIAKIENLLTSLEEAKNEALQ